MAQYFRDYNEALRFLRDVPKADEVSLLDYGQALDRLVEEITDLQSEVDTVKVKAEAAAAKHKGVVNFIE